VLVVRLATTRNPCTGRGLLGSKLAGKGTRERGTVRGTRCTERAKSQDAALASDTEVGNLQRL
jgi:hypothetical protein